MIETVMLIAIGALVACLAAIGFLPALWRRALRLSHAELRATLPITPDEVAAERDQIRAVAALEQRRLEQRAEAADLAVQSARTEIGEQLALIQRREATIVARDAEIASLTATLATRDGTIIDLHQTIQLLEHERDNLATNLDAARMAHQALDQESLALRQAAEQRQARLDEQDRQLDGLLTRVADLQNVSGTLRADLQQRTEELRATSRELREATARASTLERKQAAADALAEERSRQAVQIQEERLRLIEDAGLAARERDAVRIDNASLASQIERLGQRIAELEDTLERSRGQNSDLVRDLTRSIETLRQEKHQADDEISAMRFEKARMEAQLLRQKPPRSAREPTTPGE